MNTIIKNEFLQVEISALGAEMQSIKSKDDTEYLWQGDARTWPDRAINLFPYIGRLTEGSYQYQDKIYNMNIHGLAPYEEFAVVEQEADRVRFALAANDRTKEVYPFEFCYFIEYALKGNEILVTFQVENKDEKTMHFAVGGHPGFQVPINGEGAFEDYYLEFSEKADAQRVGFSETCFVSGEDEVFPLEDGVKLPLRHNLFDDDAIVLYNMDRKVTLKSEKTKRSVRVEYPQMDYLGFWHCPKTEVNYVCIEPWSSLPSRDGVIEDIEKQENLICLEAGKTYKNQWKISIE